MFPQPSNIQKQTNKMNKFLYLMRVWALIFLTQAWRDFVVYRSSPDRTRQLSWKAALCGPFLHPIYLSPTLSARQSLCLASGRALVAKSLWKPMHRVENNHEVWDLRWFPWKVPLVAPAKCSSLPAPGLGFYVSGSTPWVSNICL